MLLRSLGELEVTLHNNPQINSNNDLLTIYNPPCHPLIRIENDIEFKQPLTQLTTGRLKPTCMRNNIKYNHETLLYAFDRSNFITKVAIFFVLVEWKASYANPHNIRNLSPIQEAKLFKRNGFG